MISISGLSTLVALKLVDATEDKEQALLREEPEHARAIDYFLENISDVESVDDLMGDYQLYSFVMKAYDLEDQIFGKAMMEKILKSNIEEPDALINRLTDPRFKELYNAMGFGTDGEGNINTALNSWRNRVVAKYVDTQYVNDKTDENEALGTVLEFRRKAAEIESPFDILKDTEMSEFFRTILGLPAEMAALDIDRQAAMLTDRIDLATLKDPEEVEKLVRKYVAISDANTDFSSTNGAVQLLSGALSAGSGSFVPVTIDIEAIAGFSGYKLR
ncbi:DUF1217 domain-containing protein [Salipiger sp. P9]|uniref:DUF1217 domain-containing protein n=1 Tax=Salipiger pentaromativorans TaxID=2943193 RepID=UPI0021580D80|nr:DUF1217 domain-containing protein [Salipiger pentaromativorans]MCR8550507.1 DUF1217 domain-containing protein [Salipiger pentaromativorans]